jgi:hypothetical protein
MPLRRDGVADVPRRFRTEELSTTTLMRLPLSLSRLRFLGLFAMKRWNVTGGLSSQNSSSAANLRGWSNAI